MYNPILYLNEERYPTMLYHQHMFHSRYQSHTCTHILFHVQKPWLKVTILNKKRYCVFTCFMLLLTGKSSHDRAVLFDEDILEIILIIIMYNMGKMKRSALRWGREEAIILQATYLLYKPTQYIKIHYRQYSV